MVENKGILREYRLISYNRMYLIFLCKCSAVVDSCFACLLCLNPLNCFSIFFFLGVQTNEKVLLGMFMSIFILVKWLVVRASLGTKYVFVLFSQKPSFFILRFKHQLQANMMLIPKS
jgi:hypothetical protein